MLIVARVIFFVLVVTDGALAAVVPVVPAIVPSPSPAAIATPFPAVLPLAAAPRPDAATLARAIVQGRGRDNPRSTTVVTSRRNGIAGSSTTYADGEDEREIVSEGALQNEDGVLAGEAWHRNANGEVVVDADEAGKSTPDRFRDRVEAGSLPGTFVLVATNDHGTTRRTTVERMTGHVVRTELTRPSGTSVTVFDDFRTVGTETRAWHWVSTDGHPEDAAEYRIARLDTNAIAKNDLAIPAGAVFVHFPAGTTRETLPATYHHGKFYVRLTIEGRGLDFELDTGAAEIVIDEGVARQMGLAVVDRESDGANAGRFTSQTTIVPEVRIGDLSMRNVVMGTIPKFGDEEDGLRVVGLLGFDFIADTKLLLDYERGTVTAYDRNVGGSDPAGLRGFEVPIRIGSQTPQTDLVVNGALGERFMIDTGAELPMLLFDYFARRHPDALANDGPPLEAQEFAGVGGSFDTQPYRLKSVRMGNLNLADFVAYRVVSKASYSGSEDGVIGSDVLSLFTVYLDYADARIVLAPNADGRAGITK